MKLGLKPFTPSITDLKFSTYRDMETPLPKYPANFGHEKLIHDWRMLANDRVGCCVFSGAAHETMLWNASAKKTVTFSDAAVLSDYSALTGYDPHDPNSDNGTDMREAAKYRQKTGIVDDHGNRHKIGAYVFLDTYEQFLESIYLFGAAAYGFQVPQSAMDQFNNGQSWHYVKGSPIIGGHYVPGVSERSMLDLVTWGRIQTATKAFWTRQFMAGIAYISEEALTNGKSLEGFDLATLNDDLKRVNPWKQPA